MEVVAIKPRGYCFGVVNALNVVKKVVKEHPSEKIHILGIIIHNKFIKEALDRLGVISVYKENKTRLELLDLIDDGVVIFSAHGIGQDVIDKAKAKGLITYNATCPDVTKTQDLVKDYLNKDYNVLYIGKENHPESEAMLAINKDKIKLVSSVTDLENITIIDKTIVTNQTTMSVYDTKDLVDKIISINKNIIVIDEICNATKTRQEALFDLEGFDLLYVVGDHLSNNTNNLKKIAKKTLDKVILVESVKDINDDDLVNVQKVGVTAGASTPYYLSNQVIKYLEKYPNNTSQDRIIDYDKLL